MTAMKTQPRTGMTALQAAELGEPVGPPALPDHAHQEEQCPRRQAVVDHLDYPAGDALGVKPNRPMTMNPTPATVP